MIEQLLLLSNLARNLLLGGTHGAKEECPLFALERAQTSRSVKSLISLIALFC